MEIKNIRQYREFYKSTRPVNQELEEHFVGNYYLDNDSGSKKYGWFTMYHGDKDGYGRAEAGIENFLQSFLDMAKDGQAVYEFLQNAVDAKSTHYTMVWGQDEIDGNHYLLVANNGDMFDFNSIRSILNVGSSTKTADSQTIGKFGIGFKLAHRLVGKNNGLDELINEHSGPILFSWKDYEIEALAAGRDPKPMPINLSYDIENNISIKDDYPWLFKILITCFPCLPENNTVEELPKMTNGKICESAPFSKSEYQVLSRWVKNNQHILNKDTYQKGSLFFIKLGVGKETELAEDNLTEGVKFALAILKETAEDEHKNEKILATVQLNNDAPITYPDLLYLKFMVDKQIEKDTYAYIRFGIEKYEALSLEQQNKITQEANIEILFGFRQYNQIENYFKGAPNLYLYFPLSEEVHNFNYVLHSNAFYKGSSRTFLHKGNSKEDGINERLLRTIVDKIDDELSRLSLSENKEDKDLFLHFYATLLTSGRSSIKAREWIEEPYINRIDELLKKYIPVRKSFETEDFEILSNPSSIFIKKTIIDIDIDAWDLKDINWFYWGNNSEDVIQEKAKEKLSIIEFGIFDLLNRSNISIHINEWLNNDFAKITTILEEIKIYPETKGLELIKESLFELNILAFSNNDILSVNQFQDKENEGYFLIHNTLEPIRDLLIKLDLFISLSNLDDFITKFRSFFKNATHHRSYKELTILFSKSIKNVFLNELTLEDKLRIFNAFRTFNKDDIRERISELKLFKNNLGESVRFKNLYISSENKWLKPFCIHNTELDNQIKPFLLDKEIELYEGIIYPFWKNILNYLQTHKNDAKQILEDITNLYNKSNWRDKNEHLLSKWGIILYQNEVVATQKIFFQPVFSHLDDVQFHNYQTIALQYFGIYIPDKLLLPFVEAAPYNYTSIQIQTKIEDCTISESLLKDLLSFVHIANIDFFNVHRITKEEESYWIKSSVNKRQIATNKQGIIQYIDTYYLNEYVLLPENLMEFDKLVKLSHYAILDHLIERFEESDMEQELSLLALLLDEQYYEGKKALFDKLTYTILDGTWVNTTQNELYLLLLRDLVEDKNQDITKIHSKIQIEKSETTITINEIDSAADDSIIVKRGDKTIELSQAQILNLESVERLNLIRDFHNETLNRGLLTSAIADTLFKMAKKEITEELVRKFKENLNDNQLVNSHQLLFVLLSGQFKKIEIKEYSVKSHNNLWYNLGNVIVTYTDENVNQVNHRFLIHQAYENLQSLLSLNDLEVFNYGEVEENIILSHFMFVKGCNPDILLSDATLHSKLDYLYRGFKQLSSSLRVDKRGKDWDSDWENYLEFSPETMIYNGISIEAELLPSEAIEWTKNDDNKWDLLKAIGVNINESYINQVRKFILAKTNWLDPNIDFQKFNPILLKNTLIGLSGDFPELNNQPFIFDETSHFLQISYVEKMIAFLHEKMTLGIPLLVHHTTTQYKLVKPENVRFHYIDQGTHQKLKDYPNNQLAILYQNQNMLKMPDFDNEAYLKNAHLLTLNDVFVNELHIEHDEPFYRKWTIEHNVKLFKSSKLQFKIITAINGEDIVLGIITKDGHHLIEIEQEDSDEFTTEIYYSTTIDVLQLDLEQTYSELVEIFLKKRDNMLQNLYKALNDNDLEELKSEHIDALKLAWKEEELKQERQDIYKSITDYTRYSFDWFVAYLEYLSTFESKQSTTSQKSVSFQEIKRYEFNGALSNRYFLLCGASTFIPVNIEDYEDFKINLVIRNHKNESILVEGVSKRGQDLLIYCREELAQTLIDKFKEVVLININFTPVINLIERLKNAFKNPININSWEDIKEELPPIHFIYGPPGTGKTTSICSTIIDIIDAKYNAKILFLTPTNKAADVLCKKFVKPAEKKGEIIPEKMEQLKSEGKSLNLARLGKETDPELTQLEAGIYIDSLTKKTLDYQNVIASTIHRLPYFEILDEKENQSTKMYQLEDFWDYVIFDEASMINPPYLVFAIFAIHKTNPNAKFIIAGDPKQIPPVVDASDSILEELDIQDENIYKIMGIDSFKSEEQILREMDTIDNLDTQYRSVKAIGQLFSDLSYNGLLKHHRDNTNDSVKELPKEFQQIIKKNTTFMNMPLTADSSAIFRVNKLYYSSYQIYSAIFVAELLKHFDKLLAEKDSWTIGLIAPYKTQAILMNKLITSYHLSDKLKVYTDTVHGFQGDECDMIFFVCNPNNYYYSGHPKCLLSKEYIYNVAISRAKDYLVVIHPYDKIQNNPFINRIKQVYDSKIEPSVIRTSAEIEQIIFKQNDYIEKHSYMTGHDNVNIFGQIEMTYFIKANESAIDIQLRKF